MSNRNFIVTGSCRNRPGIVSEISTAIFKLNCNILDMQQFDDHLSESFFIRLIFVHPTAEADEIRAALTPVFEKLGMNWSVRDRAQPQKVLLLASRFDHCLGDLLYRWRTGELEMDVVGVVSNHPRETYNNMTLGSVDFHHFPITRDTKPEQEASIRQVVEDTGADLVVLARYMQVLSDEMSTYLSGRCINIHHSFLPSFMGAKPYHQAFKRGVKLIGATAHYVTADLDEGPIIEQDVESISHRDTPDDLVRRGRDIERRVLARAVRNHLDGRVLLNGKKTIVFPE